MKPQTIPILFTLLVALIAPTVLAAQEAVENTSGEVGASATGDVWTLTPSEAVERVLAASRAIQSAQVDLAIQAAAARNSWNRFLPSLQLSAGPSYSFAEDLVERWSASGQVSARLTLSGSTRTVPETRDLAVRKSSLALEQQEWQLRREVLRSYFQIVSRQASVELQEQRVAAARRRLVQIEENFETGVVSEFSVLEARLSYQNTLPELTGAEQRLRTAQRDFRSLLRIPEDEQIELVTDIPFLALNHSAEQLLSEHAPGAPAIREAQLGRASAALDLERKENGLLPSVSLSASVGYAGQEPFELTDQAINRTGSGSITVTFPFDPFIAGSDGALGRSESQRRVEIAGYRLDSAEEELYRSLRNAVDGARASATQIEVVERNAELAERVYQIAQERFEAGAIDALELQNSEVERTRARVAVIEQRLSHVQSLIEIEYLLGVELEDLPW